MRRRSAVASKKGFVESTTSFASLQLGHQSVDTITKIGRRSTDFKTSSGFRISKPGSALSLICVCAICNAGDGPPSLVNFPDLPFTLSEILTGLQNVFPSSQ